MKDLVMPTDMESSVFAFLQKLPQISMKRIKAGIFDDLQIREHRKDSMFDEVLSEAVLSAWHLLKSLVTNFLWNHQSVEYKKEIEKFLPTQDTNVSQNALSAVTLFSKELWRFEWRAGWVLSPRVLPRLMGCKLSCWLLLVLETGCSGCQTLEEVPVKIFHPRIVSFVYFSVYYGTTWAFCEYISVINLAFFV